MATYRLNMADEKLIEEVTDPDTLIKHIPRIETFYEGVQDWKRMERASSTRGPFTGKSGFTSSKNLQHLGWVPQSVVAAVLMIDPEFWTTPAKVLKFFQAHPEYIVVD